MTLNLEPINELHRKIQAVLKEKYMINPTELRIGNRVLYKPYGSKGGEPVIIHGMLGMKAYFDRHSNESGMFHHLQPIPLTPDILEKCAFTSQEGYDFPTYEDQYGDRISFDGGVWKYWLGGIYQDWAEIRALHRLQNFYFEYTNRELEVKL